MLVATQAVWAAPMPTLDRVSFSEAPSFFQIEIPETLASVEEVYEAPASLDPKVILHIQNVHGNYQAQVQVKKMLDYFYKNYGFKIIFCEGAADKLDSKYLEFFSDKKDNLAVADDLAKKGQLTGPELYLMEAPEDVRAVGIEQPELYRGNYEAFRIVTGSTKTTESFLKLLDSRLELLSSRFLTRDMRRILSEWQKFHQGRREFLPFIKHLADESQKLLNLDLNSLFAQVEWPQTARLLVLQSMEADLKHDEAMAERDQLIAFLKEHQASQTLITGLQKMEEKTINLQRLAKGKEEDPFLPRKLLERLAQEAVPKGFQFHQYPNFSLYAGYTILESELDSKILFQEVEKLFERLLESLTISEKEKNLLELYKDLELLKKLVSLELSRPEWDQATYRKNWIKPQSLVERLEKMSASGFVTENLAVDKQIPVVFDAAFSFYDFARQREFAFYDAIELEMTAQKSDRAILVTGGFHTDGLSDIFRSKQMNYGVLTPRMGGDFDKKNYIATMMESQPTIFDLAQLEMRAKLGSISSQILLGGDPAKIMESVLDAFRTRFEDIAHSDRVQARDTAFLSEMVRIFNQSLDYHAEGAGFVRLLSDDGSYQYWFRAVTDINDDGRVRLGPLVNRKGQVITFTLNSNFKVSQAMVVDRIQLEALMTRSQGPVEREFNVPKDTVAATAEQRAIVINNARARVTAGGLSSLFRSAPTGLGVDLPELNRGRARSPVTEAQLRVPSRDFRGPELADSVLGSADSLNPDEVQVAIDALAGRVPSRDAFFRYVEILNRNSAGRDAVTVASIARELAGLENGIPEQHAAWIETLFAPSDQPVAEVIRLSDDYSSEDMKEIAGTLQVLFGLNSKLYVTLLTNDRVTPQQIDAYKKNEFAKVIAAAEGRFSLASQAGFNTARISRELVSRMQRAEPSLPRGSLFSLTGEIFVQADDATLVDVPEDFKPFYGRLVADFDPASTNAPSKVRRALLHLRVSLAAKLPQLKGEAFDEKLAALLTQYEDDENIFSLNGNAVSMVTSLLKVFAAYNAAVEKISASA